MSSELQIAKHLKCIRCGGPVARKDSSEELFTCNGGENKHPVYAITSKFDTPEGELPEGPWMSWRDKIKPNLV